MYGVLTYDGDGNMIASLMLYKEGDLEGNNPVIGMLSVNDMATVLDRFGVDGDLYRGNPSHASAMAVLASAMEKTIEAKTFLKPFVNSSNGHHDIGSAMVVACEPGPGIPATFRLTV
jgi:hypothetical protein